MSIIDFIWDGLRLSIEMALNNECPMMRMFGYYDENGWRVNGVWDEIRNIMGTENEPELEEAMKPFCQEFVMHPELRMVDDHTWYEQNKPIELSDRREATRLVEEYFCKCLKHKSIIPADGGLFELTECAIDAISGKQHNYNFYFDVVRDIVCDGYDEDWEALYQKVRPELVHGPKDYNRIRVTCFAYLMAVTMICRNQELSRGDKEAMLMQLTEYKTLKIIFLLFSVLTGLVVYQEVNNMLQVVNNFTDWHKPYAHLLQAALKYKPGVLQTQNANKEKQYKDARERLEKALTSEEANHKLDELFHTIFPRVEMELYAQPTQRMTAAETHKRLTDQQKTIEELTHTIDAQQVELSELRPLRQLADDITRKYNEDSITFDELAQAILSIANAEKAQQIYFYLNNRLRKNAAWLHGRDWLEDQIDARLNGESVRAQTERMEAAVNSRPNVIGQLNMGDGTQQLPDNLKRLENLKTD